jgi:NADH-quinone oxidoreductase subunit L/NAD(P)H-quinone oxidoreductase subunit 5
MVQMDILALLPGLLALAGGAAAGAAGAAPPHGAVRMAVFIQKLVFLTAAILAVLAFSGTTIAGLAFAVDRLSAVILVLTAGISLTVHAFSVRYMDGDAAELRFFRDIGLMTGAILVMVAAADAIPFVLAWIGASWALASLIGHRRNWAAARASRAKTLRFLSVGDAALVLAAILAVAVYGTTSLAGIADAAAASPDGVFAIAIAVLLLIAAIAKSAQLPLHGWLPDTMTAPTPVSALMHAGFVNAGGYLLARFAELFLAQPAVLMAAFLIGAATALLGSAAMLVQPDVKRSLAYSTVGQMGFMVMQCGLGAFFAAIYHLVVHGIFKATLFLGAGSVIQNARDLKNAPAARAKGGKAGPALLAIALIGGGGLTGLAYAGVNPASLLLAVFALLAMVQAVTTWVRHPEAPGSGLPFAAATVAVGLTIYLGGLAAFASLLSPALPIAPPEPGIVHWLVPAAFVALLLVSVAGFGRDGAGRLRDWLYVRLLFLGARPKRIAESFTHRTDPC